MKINLHMHTTCSDGSLKKEDLADLIKKEDLDIFSITDHDTIDSNFYFKEKFENKFIPGVELSVACPDIKEDTLHLLIYDFDMDKMKIELDKLSKKRKENAHIAESLLQKDGYNISIKNDKVEYQRQICNLLVDSGYSPNRIEASKKILKNYSNYFISPSIKEAFEIARKTLGKTSWAHPYNIIVNTKKVFIQESRIKKILAPLLQNGLDALEAHYFTFSKSQGLFLQDLSLKHNLKMSCGTDFHRHPTPLFYKIEKRKVTFLDKLK